MQVLLEKKDRSKWLENQLTFLKPLGIFVGILYLGAIIPKVQGDGFQLNDLAVTNVMVTAIALYIFNNAYDYLRKLKG